MSHEKLTRCQSANTFHIDGATYQIIPGEEGKDGDSGPGSGNGTPPGVKILKKVEGTFDLSADLSIVTTVTVTQRLKLIAERLEAKEQISRDALIKNIGYAIELIQCSTRADSPDLPSSTGNSTTTTTTPTTTNTTRDQSNDCASTKLNVDLQVDPVRVKVNVSARADENLRSSTSGGKTEGGGENELSNLEVEEEKIPDEVREWLAATFTRTNVVAKPRSERPRFRSVANAIRVGLFVDRFYRQVSTAALQIPAEVNEVLKEINNWHFDVFKLHEVSNSQSLKYIVKDLFGRYGLISKFRINLEYLENFLCAIEYGYTKLKNPYHNDSHAADVTQTLHFFITSSGIVNSLTDLEIFALLFAALIHDFEHTGRTNNFHINTSTDLSLIYNDRAVLENHHVSAAFRLMRDDDKNILHSLKKEEYREFRALVIEMVLSTDMSTHFNQVKNVKAIINGERHTGAASRVDKQMSMLNLLLHSADISHPGKPWKTHKKFADMIIEEFFMQGDEESRLGLPFSPLCDRKSVLVPESQVSFIEIIVEPSLTLLSDFLEFLLAEERAENDASRRHSIARRTESDNCTVNDRRNSRISSAVGSGPGQGSASIVQKPWIHHFTENKTKWKSIAAEREIENLTASIIPSEGSEITIQGHYDGQNQPNLTSNSVQSGPEDMSISPTPPMSASESESEDSIKKSKEFNFIPPAPPNPNKNAKFKSCLTEQMTMDYTTTMDTSTSMTMVKPHEGVNTTRRGSFKANLRSICEDHDSPNPSAKRSKDSITTFPAPAGKTSLVHTMDKKLLTSFGIGDSKFLKPNQRAGNPSNTATGNTGICEKSTGSPSGVIVCNPQSSGYHPFILKMETSSSSEDEDFEKRSTTNILPTTLEKKQWYHSVTTVNLNQSPIIKSSKTMEHFENNPAAGYPPPVSSKITINNSNSNKYESHEYSKSLPPHHSHTSSSKGFLENMKDFFHTHHVFSNNPSPQIPIQGLGGSICSTAGDVGNSVISPSNTYTCTYSTTMSNSPTIGMGNVGIASSKLEIPKDTGGNGGNTTSSTGKRVLSKSKGNLEKNSPSNSPKHHY